MNKENRLRGALIGLAVGDALGTTLEFKPYGSFSKHTDITGGGPFRLVAGEWTDDTSMALCLAASLVECRFDLKDQIERYVRWRRHGYMSSNGICFDIGNAVSAALSRYEATGDPKAGSSDPRSGGNGSLMRLAPVPIRYADNPLEAIVLSAESSLTTHAAPTTVDACRYFAGLLVGAFQGVDKSLLLSPMYNPIAPDFWDAQPLAEEIAAIAAGSFKEKEPPEINGRGYVVTTLEAALWAFHKSDNFRDGAILAVNLGDDADTVGAVYGQIAGAYYGEEGIPAEWRKVIAKPDLIEELLAGLLAGRVISR